MRHVTEYPSAKTGEYPWIYPKWYSPIFKPYVHYDRSLRFKFNSRLESVLWLLQKKGHVLCSYSCTSEHWKVNILCNKRWTVRRHFPRALEKYLREDKHNSFHLTQKYCGIFVFRHYLSLKAVTFSRASLSETFRISEQVMSEQQQKQKTVVHVFAPNGDYCLLGISEIVGRVYRLLQHYIFISA